MIKFYIKYFFILLWGLQVLQQTSIPFNFKPLLYAIMGVSLLMTFYLSQKNNKFFFNDQFLLIHWVIGIYILYWILFDHSLFGIQYIVLKIAIFGLMAATIYFNYDEVKNKYPIYMLYIGTAVLLMGVLTNHSFGSRYTGPFANSNSLGFLSVLMFSITLFYIKSGIKKNMLLLFFGLLALASGSRAAFGGLLLAYLLKDRISLKKIFTLVAGAILLFGLNKVASSYGFTTGIDRLISTNKKNELLAGREEEYTLGLLSIKEEPIMGHGLDHYAHLSDRIVKLSGVLRRDASFAANPHNSFIALFIQLGIPFGIVLLIMLLYYVGKSTLYQPRNEVYLIMLLYPFLSGFFESHLFGVNGYEGTSFWFALIFYQMYMKKEKEEKIL